MKTAKFSEETLFLLTYTSTIGILVLSAGRRAGESHPAIFALSHHGVSTSLLLTWPFRHADSGETDNRLFHGRV